MRLRVNALALIAVLCATVAAAAEPQDRWTAVAKAPRPSLPDVHVTLGYPGSYLPTWNSPIELRATASTPFNGFIGYRFAVGQQGTRELPVVSPARLAAGESWAFSTWARLKPTESWRSSGWGLNRELVIEWRNEQMAVVAKTSVGVPPWAVVRPLYVGDAAPDRVLGSDPYVVRAGALPNVAQWYQGFAAVVVALPQWLELRADVREAIGGSPKQIVFTGFARSGQTMSALDRALLPVVFSGGAMTYVVPWPYPEPRTRNAPASWVAKPETSSISEGAGSPLVIGRGSAWAATEDLIHDQLPETGLAPAYGKYLIPASKWSLKLITSEFGPLAAAIVMLLISVGGWLAMRKHPRTTAALIVVALAVIPVALRQRLRPGPSTETRELVQELSDGLLMRTVTTVEVGPAPLGARPVAPQLARTAVFSEETTRETEIRMAGTPIGFGEMFNSALGWDSAQRSWTRRELGSFPSVRVVEARRGRLVIDYDSPERLDYAVARWFADGIWWRGTVELPHPTKGRVTVPHQVLLPHSRWSEVRQFGERRSLGVHLIQVRDGGVKEFATGRRTRNEDVSGTGFIFDSTLERASDGTFGSALRMPPGVLRNAGAAHAVLGGDVNVRELIVVTERGSWRFPNQLEPPRPGAAMRNSGVFDISADALASIANGGIVQLKVRPESEPPPGSDLTILVSIGGKKS